MVTPAIIRKNFPEFENETTQRISFFIAMAENRTNPDFFKTKYDDAVTLLTCHLLTLANRGGIGGSVTSEKVGDLSRGYSAPQGTSLGSTSYGQLFDELSRRCRPIPFVTGC